MYRYPSAVVFKDKVYLGGGTAPRDSQSVIVYDTEQDLCDTLPPYTFKWFSMMVINNQLVLALSTGLAFNGSLLAVGGGSTPSSPIYHYQSSSGRWVEAGEPPKGRSGCTCACTCTVLPSGDLFVAAGIGAERRVDIASVQ